MIPARAEAERRTKNVAGSRCYGKYTLIPGYVNINIRKSVIFIGNKKRKNKTAKESEHLGACVLYCKKCDYEFEIDWETIFDIQEATHGYVGMHLNDVYISCPKCDEIISEESDTGPSLHDTKNKNQNKMPIDDDLPF